MIYLTAAAGRPAGIPPPSQLGGLGRDAKQITCPYCHQVTTTVPRDQIECLTVGICVFGVLSVFGPCVGCRS